ncbi:MACPF domain-containing protein CAD1 [Zostera marina]|uniref:MACPF domain-containing protein CAD1 n=1 Tax=Zostera marina TaxID=29655 RepID=A0A0K9P8Q3_ZOSMR|nr:MACPF domain-containing protein CAD1 [Zostera marina]
MSSSGQDGVLLDTLHRSVLSLGRGFDVTSDTRLLYCKGAPGSTLVDIDELNTRDLIPGLSNVSIDIDIVEEASGRNTTPVLPFLQMSKCFNKKSHLDGHIPLGSFNSMFNFTGPWKIDAATTKSLAMDGFFIPLYKVILTSKLILKEEIQKSIPHTWEPESLSSFIENYGTHIITSVTIGGQDVVYVKQQNSSLLSKIDIEKYVKDIGDQRFKDSDSLLSSGPVSSKADPSLANNRDGQLQSSNTNHLSRKEDITVIFRRRGGDDLVQDLNKWKETINSSPDVINMTFLPITYLLDDSIGSKHLVRAIDLYLEYKPSIEELQYFLDFQIQRVWAPEQNNARGHQRKEPVCPSLQFSLMGSKIFISSEQITVGRKPVTGLRLCLESSKQNRLSIHLQHLSTLPKILQSHWNPEIAIGAPKWQGPEEQDSRWFQPIKWKNFAHVSTAPVEHTETNIGDLSGVFIVTGSQLGVWDFGAKSVLYLKLLFSKVPGCSIRRSVWDHSPNTNLQVQDELALSYSNEKRDVDDKKSESIQSGKFAKIIDTTEMLKGPQDTPGHWLVTGAKLGIEKGKIVIRVKYSLLNY